MPITKKNAPSAEKAADPYRDPVAYLASLGIDAELVAVEQPPIAPAA